MKLWAILSIVAAMALTMSILLADERPMAAVQPVEVSSGGGQKPISALIVYESDTFARELYAKLAADTKGNMFFSPFSLDTALAMTYCGAAGNTADQMAKTLHSELRPDMFSIAHGELLRFLKPPPIKHAIDETGKPTTRPAYELVVANALWGQKGCAFKPDFTQLLQKSYGAGVNEVNFSQTEPARKTINDWVAKETKDKIKDLLPKDTLNNSTRLVLTNAIYFKSNWAQKFAKSVTKDAPFKLTADKSVDVPMMHQQREFGYAENDDVQVLTLPYIDNDLSMVIVLPRKVDGLADVEKSRTFGVGKETQLEVDVTLPKFKFSSDLSLADTLKAMGITDAFDATKADFSGMADKEKLFLSAVIHKAFVAVDEDGTEATAATAVAVAAADGHGHAPQEPKIFKADHPFMFMIRHNATGDILFMGRVADPKGE
jgi:serpin B